MQLANATFAASGDEIELAKRHRSNISSISKHVQTILREMRQD